MEAKRREKAEEKQANRFETMMERVIDRLDIIDDRLQRIEGASMEKTVANDQIVACAESIETTAQGLEGRMANVERRIEASETKKSVEALRAAGAEVLETLNKTVKHLEVGLSNATQALVQALPVIQDSLACPLEQLVSISQDAEADRCQIMHLIITPFLMEVMGKTGSIFSDMSLLDLSGKDLGEEAAQLLASYIRGNKSQATGLVLADASNARSQRPATRAIGVSRAFACVLNTRGCPQVFYTAPVIHPVRVHKYPWQAS
jgi:hypothetical protein